MTVCVPQVNICEHCPNFRTDAASISVLGAQRLGAEALAADAEARGWLDEAPAIGAWSPVSTPCCPEPLRRDCVRPWREWSGPVRT